MQATVHGHTVHYEVSGRGPWLTLSHSLAAHSGMWAPQLAALEPHFTVLRYDTRGHGGSSAPPGPYTLEQLADDAQALLQHLGVQRTHWLGLSMGGMVGQTLALRHPTLLDRVVLADTTGRVPPAGAALWAERAALARSAGMQALVQPTLARWFTPPFHAAQPTVVADIGAMIAATPVEGYAGCCAALAATDTLDGLRCAAPPRAGAGGGSGRGHATGRGRRHRGALAGRAAAGDRRRGAPAQHRAGCRLQRRGAGLPARLIKCPAPPSWAPGRRRS